MKIARTFKHALASVRADFGRTIATVATFSLALATVLLVAGFQSGVQKRMEAIFAAFMHPWEGGIGLTDATEAEAGRPRPNIVADRDRLRAALIPTLARQAGLLGADDVLVAERPSGRASADEQMRRTFRVTALVVALVTLIGGMAGFVASVLLIVRERLREIALRRAIGATRVRILSELTVETAVFAATSAIVGTVRPTHRGASTGVGVCRAVRRAAPARRRSHRSPFYRGGDAHEAARRALPELAPHLPRLFTMTSPYEKRPALPDLDFVPAYDPRQYELPFKRGCDQGREQTPPRWRETHGSTLNARVLTRTHCGSAG